MPQNIIPQIPNKERFSSGFQLPKISPEEALEKYGYFIGRPASQMLPVYFEITGYDHVDDQHIKTKLRKAEGNLFQLKSDIDAFLYKRYKREFVSQISELQQMITYSSDLEDELREFLLNKGF